ncbi:MAG: hypothetical protein C5B58_08085 [Acidobacteria bacterium]|nr:MAG: hypothetical protein C5B58_08085 [Acidobacteriota bacterium]
MRPRREVARGRCAFDESRRHRRSHEVELVHRLQAQDLLDRPSHIDLGVVGVVGRSVLYGKRADDEAWAAMTVDVVDAVLCVIFLHEDRRRGPHVAVGDVVDDPADGQVVVRLLRGRSRRSARVVVHNPEDAQCRHSPGRKILVEVLYPQIDSELIGNIQIENREVLDQVV